MAMARHKREKARARMRAAQKNARLWEITRLAHELVHRFIRQEVRAQMASETNLAERFAQLKRLPVRMPTYLNS